ncbi:MAG: hypothetical protein J7L53_12660 [Deltaproteobacteria bacterium]|nr:hypothetical protein [Deltaproteobacteria bacterium]
MADIKSTIDIVMERTKNLTMTEEEKDALRQKEWTGKVRGWVRKFLDGQIDAAELKTDLEAEEKAPPALKNILKTELITHLQLGGDNRRIFHALEEALDISKDPFIKMIQSFQSNMDEHKARHLEHLRTVLMKRGIHGSSVIPNLAHDKGWIAYEQQSKTDFNRALTSLTDN